MFFQEMVHAPLSHPQHTYAMDHWCAREPTGSACGEHRRMVPFAKMSGKGRIELQLNVSGKKKAKNLLVTSVFG